MPLPTYLMSNFPSVRPSLNLQFDSQPTPEDMTSHLASVGATFSRASIGTYTDANGIIQEATSGQARPNYSAEGVHEGLLIEESRTNLIKSSQDFTANSYNQSLNIIIERHANVSTPIEGAVADKIIADTTTGGHYRGQSVSVTSGTDYTHSVIVKADGESNLRFGFASAQFGSKALVIDLDDIDNPLLDTVDSKTIEDLGDGWYKISITAECTTSGTSNFAVGLGSTFSYAGNGTDGMFAVAHQVEEGSFPTSYIPTIPTFTSRASDGTYFDSSGVLQTTSGERIDHKYIDGQWVEAGLLLEGASENLFTYSEDFSTSWVESQLVVTTNTIQAPDGNTTADTLTDDNDGGSGSTTLYNIKTITADTDYTFSVFAKKKTNDWFFLAVEDFDETSRIWFDLENGVVGTEQTAVSGSIENVGNGWYRCSLTYQSTSDLTGTFRIGLASADGQSSITRDGTNDVYIWGAQLEEGSQPTSYIATSGSTATRSADVYTTATKERSADVCYIDGTAFSDFYNQEEGTLFVDYRKYGGVTQSGSALYVISDGTNNERVGLTDNITSGRYGFFSVSNNVLQYSSTTTFPTTVANTRIKLIGSYTSTNASAKNNTGVSFSASGSYTLPTVSEVGIGYDSIGGTKQLNGAIKKFIYFPRSLSDNELTKLTQ